uniref:Cytochrome c oxidase subunit 5A, mitochondrial n=1 Tax=Aotus nancymaae TaxID=37293 RepID=A0A2K5E4H5_AOTNA
VLCAAFRHCAVAATSRAGPRGLLHSAPTPAPPRLKIIDAALRACRRLNDFASTIRILEAVKDKAGPHKEIYPYVIQEPRPTFNKLGISTPEELGLDKSVNPMDGLPKDLLILLLECKQSPGNTDDNILSYLNKFSFIEYQAI